MDLEDYELCLIDSGIKSLQDVPLHQNLRVLNLHSNHIRTIQNLHSLQSLTHLDLSSNKIRTIEGLAGLTSLKALNLSCNFIQVVSGLQNLRSLTKLILSYNQIKDISGIGELVASVPSCQLMLVELQGNRIDNLAHIVSRLEACAKLRKLFLCQSGATNPVCQQSGYRDVLLRALPALKVLDNRDRSGKTVADDLDDTMTDVPGLEKYMDFLLSNSSSATDLDPVSVITPKIDAAMEAFKQRGVSSSDFSATAGPSSASDTDTLMSVPQRMDRHGNIQPNETRTEYEMRLENQLAQLLYGGNVKALRKEQNSDKKNMNPALLKKKTATKDDSDDSEESDKDDRSRSHKGRRSRIPSYQRSTSASRGGQRRGDEDGVKSKSPTRASTSRSGGHPSPKQSNIRKTVSRDDEKQREDVQNTYVTLMQELEVERERRWKAEQATRKLVDHIKELQSKASQDKDLSEVAVQATNRLKQALSNEREGRVRLQAEIEILKEQLSTSTHKIAELEQAEGEMRKTVHSLEVTSTQAERERLQQRAHERQRVQQAGMRAAANQREAELLQAQVSTLKQQLHQMQELLANREQDHRKALEGQFSLESKEFKDILDQEVRKVERVKTQEIELQQKRITEVTKQYQELEDEFRLALQIEASRFAELKDSFEHSSKESAENREALVMAQRKDQKSAEMIAELTALVKEQKGRLTELSRTKHEQSAEYKARAQELEAHLEEARRRMLQLELFKKEKMRLQSTLQAQESVMEGLKAERKLWSEELAQQGSALSQDRGRLEAKIEALTSETSMLRKQLDREVDAVRIKSKLIEDQTETIRKLKEGIVERDAELRKTREDVLKVQREAEGQVAQEVTATQELQEKMERLTDRKEQLKDMVMELEDKLEESHKAHEILNKKWKEKSSVIGHLEQQVNSMKHTWESKEKKLTVERDRAVNAAGVAVDKLKSMDDAFRKQLDRKEEAHQKAMESLADDKQRQVDSANQRVFEVEDEMRQLLRETDASKRATESKVKKLTSALGDLQSDLL